MGRIVRYFFKCFEIRNEVWEDDGLTEDGGEQIEDVQGLEDVQNLIEDGGERIEDV